MFLKKINDIRLVNDEIILKRQLDTSADDIEKRIALLPYSGNAKEKDEQVEKAKLPPFAQVFYYLLFRDLIIPDEETFFRTWCELTGKEDNGKIEIAGKTYSKEGIRNRLLRTYPSLIRDFHFYILLKEKSHYRHISYSLSKDYYQGIDLEIEHNSKIYSLSIHINTPRGAGYKQIKKQRHDYSSVNEIVLNVDFNTMKKTGPFFLLTEKHIEQLNQSIHE